MLLEPLRTYINFLLTIHRIKEINVLKAEDKAIFIVFSKGRKLCKIRERNQLICNTHLLMPMKNIRDTLSVLINNICRVGAFDKD